MKAISIRTRLIFLFTLQILIMLSAGGFYLNWRLQRTLDAELSDKLELLARAAALQIDIDLLTGLTAGDEGTRTYHNLSNQLALIKSATGVRRLYIFTKDQSSLLDTRAEVFIGDTYAFIPLTQKEMDSLFLGQVVSSTLFTGSDGRRYKAGFAPIRSSLQIVAALAVEGSAQTFEAIKTVRRDLLIWGLLVLIGSVLLGLFFSERITTPLNRLKESAAAIGRGDYDISINVAAHDEIGFLANTMEEMRRAIVQRDIRQKTMLAGVAHEIRNPLGGIELFAGLLASEVKEDKAREEAQKIQREVRNLKKIVNDFLDYAKPQKAEKAPCRISDVFDEVVMLLATELSDIDCKLHEKTAGTKLYLDSHHFRQILMNLIKNASEAIVGNGEIELLVDIRAGYVELTLSDTGPGIPDNIRERLFEPFFTTRQDGAGLGLAIVKSLVEENGGEIYSIDKSSTGAAFRLRFSSGE